MAGKKKGIRIWREKGRIGRQKRMFGWGELLTAFFTACLACAWWAGILSVFPIVLSLAWLYGVIVLLSATCAFILCCMGKWAAVPLFAAAGKLLVFPLEEMGGRRAINLVYDAGYPHLPAADKFIQEVKKLYL